MGAYTAREPVRGRRIWLRLAQNPVRHIRDALAAVQVAWPLLDFGARMEWLSACKSAYDDALELAPGATAHAARGG